MHNIEIEVVEMALDVIKFAISRITETNPQLGFPKREEELRALVGETITAKGIGGEKAFELFREVLLKASVSIDHPRHLAFVSGAPTRAAMLFDLVTAASSIHGAYWMEGSGGIFAENQAMRWLVDLTGLPDGAFGVFTPGGTEANLSAMVTAREEWRARDDANRSLRGIVVTSDGAHSSIKAMAKVIDADVIFVPTEERFQEHDLSVALNQLSAVDRKRLFAVIATAGTTNAGIVDDLDGLASVCDSENIWFFMSTPHTAAELSRHPR